MNLTISSSLVPAKCGGGNRAQRGRQPPEVSSLEASVLTLMGRIQIEAHRVDV